MKKYQLKIKPSYNPKTQAKVGWMAAQLDEQLASLKKYVSGLTVKQLEWQLRPGMNTVGQLLAHMAVAEAWWMKVAPKGIGWNEEGQKLITRVCGFEDDDIPLPPDGVHPKRFKGWSADKYLAALAKTRRHTHIELKKLTDKDLDTFFKVGKSRASYGAMIHHVLEHFCSHFGQILLLRHMMRDAKVLKVKKAKK